MSQSHPREMLNKTLKLEKMMLITKRKELEIESQRKTRMRKKVYQLLRLAHPKWSTDQRQLQLKLL
jgi:hypothetical protein